MRNLSTLSGPKLEALIEKLDTAHSVTLRAAIDHGYGNVRMNEMRAIHDEPVAAAHIRASDELSAARDELERRRRWHGTNRPIKRG
jgi:acetylglutamate kinase